ncbi:hypothetical protein Trydic_g18267 [Trypoxylus dichotomus]
MEKLNISEGLQFEETVTKEQYHIYYPRVSSFSYIYIEGTFKPDTTGTGSCQVTNNAYAFLFDQVRFDINGVEVDRCTKPVITSTIKAYISYSDNESKSLEIAGWSPNSTTQPTISAATNKFNACIPLKFLLGLAEDYQKILINASQELILLRARGKSSILEPQKSGEPIEDLDLGNEVHDDFTNTREIPIPKLPLRGMNSTSFIQDLTKEDQENAPLLCDTSSPLIFIDSLDCSSRDNFNISYISFITDEPKMKLYELDERIDRVEKLLEGAVPKLCKKLGEGISAREKHLLEEFFKKGAKLEKCIKNESGKLT